MLEKAKVSQLLDHNISFTQSLITFVHVHTSETALERWMNCSLSSVDKIASLDWRQLMKYKAIRIQF